MMKHKNISLSSSKSLRDFTSSVELTEPFHFLRGKKLSHVQFISDLILKTTFNKSSNNYFFYSCIYVRELFLTTAFSSHSATRFLFCLFVYTSHKFPPRMSQSVKNTNINRHTKGDMKKKLSLN